MRTKISSAHIAVPTIWSWIHRKGREMPPFNTSTETS